VRARARQRLVREAIDMLKPYAVDTSRLTGWVDEGDVTCTITLRVEDTSALFVFGDTYHTKDGELLQTVMRFDTDWELERQLRRDR